MSLWIPIGINNRLYKSGLNEMRGQAKAFSGEVRGMFESAFSFVAIIAGFRTFMGEMDRVKDLSDRFDETAESIQRVSLAGNQAGADIELIAKATSKLTIAAGNAASGNATLNAQFAELNINAAEFVGMSMEDKLLALSQAYEIAQGSGSKLTTFMELLGGRAQDLIPLLAQGPDALRAAFEACVPASQAAVDSVDAFNDQIAVIKQNGSVVFAWLIQVFRSVALVIPIAIVAIKSAWDQLSATISSTVSGMDSAMAALSKGSFKGAVAALKAAKTEYNTTMRQLNAEAAGAAKELSDQLKDIWGAGEGQDSPANNLTDDFTESLAAAKKLEDAKKDIADQEKANRMAALDDEARLQAMIAERTELLKQANDTTEAGLAAKKEAVVLEGKIAEAQRTAAKEKADRDKQLADKLEKARRAEADVDEKNKVAGMDDPEKQAYFRKKQKDLFDQAAKAEKAGDQVKGAELRTEAKNLEDDAHPDKEKLARAREAEAAIDEKNRLAAMSDEQKRDALKKKQADLLKQAEAAAKKGDEVKATELRTEAKGLEEELRPDTKKKSKFSIEATSLASAGGGGFVAQAATDPLLRAQERGNNLLDRIARAVESQSGYQPTVPPPQ